MRPTQNFGQKGRLNVRHIAPNQKSVNAKNVQGEIFPLRLELIQTHNPTSNYEYYGFHQFQNKRSVTVIMFGQMVAVVVVLQTSLGLKASPCSPRPRLGSSLPPGPYAQLAIGTIVLSRSWWCSLYLNSVVRFIFGKMAVPSMIFPRMLAVLHVLWLYYYLQLVLHVCLAVGLQLCTPHAARKVVWSVLFRL